MLTVRVKRHYHTIHYLAVDQYEWELSSKNHGVDWCRLPATKKSRTLLPNVVGNSNSVRSYWHYKYSYTAAFC